MEFKWVEFPFSYNAWSEEKSVHKSIKIICFVEVLYWCSVEYKLAFLLCGVVTKEKVSVIVLISGWFPPTQESISVSCKLHHLMIFFLTLTFPKIKHMFADLPQQESESFLIFSWMHPPPFLLQNQPPTSYTHAVDHPLWHKSPFQRLPPPLCSFNFNGVSNTITSSTLEI